MHLHESLYDLDSTSLCEKSFRCIFSFLSASGEFGGQNWRHIGSIVECSPIFSLNDTKTRSLKPSDKPFKFSDSHDLYLLVNLGGSRLWYLKYRVNGKGSRIALGAYPL